MKTAGRWISVVFVCTILLCMLPVKAAMAMAYRTVEVKIPVTCVRPAQRDDYRYEILIEPEDTASPKPENEQLRLTGYETGAFQIDISEPGTFLYRVYQKAGQDDHVSYDSRVYLVTVFVITDKDDNLRCSVSTRTEGKSEKPDELRFCNTVAPHGADDDSGTASSSRPESVPAVSSSRAGSAVLPVRQVVSQAAAESRSAHTEPVITVLTGDRTPVVLVAAAAILSACMAAVFLLKKINRHKQGGSRLRTKHKRLFLAVMAVFLLLSVWLNSMIASADGSVVYSAALEDFLTGWRLTIGEDVYDQDTPETCVIDYKKDVLYSLVLTFEEKSDLQFDTSGAAMTFPLPDGFHLKDDFSSILNVSLGKWGTLANNPITYDKSSNTLILRWNTADEVHMRKFRDSASALIKIALTDTLGGNQPDVLSINQKTYTLQREDQHNASVRKDGAYDPIGRKIDYKVEVLSDGTTSDLTLTDTMGTALTYNGDITLDTDRSVNTAHTVPDITVKTGNTFSVNIPRMNDGDCLVFVYSASVDTSGIACSGNATFEEVGNTAAVYGDAYTADNTDTFYESTITFSDLVKDSKGLYAEYRAGIPYYNIQWQVVTNKDCMYPLAGTSITDSIEQGVQPITSYYGDGVQILCYTNNVLSETRFVTWAELGINPAADKSWTYHIPETDPTYKYVLNYSTTVNMTGQTDSFVVKNTAMGKGGIDSAYEVLSPSDGNVGVSKTAVEQTENSVVWEIKVHLKNHAFDLEELVLQEHQNSRTVNGKTTWGDDFLPYKWLQNPNNPNSNILCKETLDTLEVIGLQDDETFVLHYGGLTSSNNTPTRHPAGTDRTIVAENSWHSIDWKPEKLSIEFYKDMLMEHGGLNAPEDGTNERTVTIRLKTKFPEEWAQYAKQQNINNMDNNTWRFQHLNWVSIGGAYDVDKIVPYPLAVFKRILREADTGHNMVFNGRIYPVFYYQVLVTGVQSDTPLVIDDVFDTSILKLYTPHVGPQMSEQNYLNGDGAKSYDDWYLTTYGGLSDYLWMSNKDNGSFVNVKNDPEHSLTQEETDYGMRFTLHKLPRDKNGEYYKFYGVEYWLTAKDEEALKEIEKMAAASSDGRTVFTNTATCRGETARAMAGVRSKNDFSPIEKYSDPFVEYLDGTTSAPDNRDPDKTVSRFGLNYRIDLNKEKAALNGGADIVAEDSYSSNLSIDFTSIQITTDPPGQPVSYDYSGNVGRFTIPDQTHVTIQYQATVISSQQDGIVSVGNTVTMLNYSRTKNDDINYSSSLGSTAPNPSILIKKYERGHMESGLNGAVFQLYQYKEGATGNTEADWEPVRYAATYAPTGEGRVPNPKSGQIITFTTENLTIADKHYGDGYANVELTNTEHGMNLSYNTHYGLREIQTPVRSAGNGEVIGFKSPHAANFFCYKFTLTNSPSGVDYSQYIYLPDETMTVKNDPDSVSVRMNKQIEGNAQLSDVEKNGLTYQLYYQQTVGGEQKYLPIMKTQTENGVDVQVVNPHFVGITYQDVTADAKGYVMDGLRLENGAASGHFLLVERGNSDILQNHPDWNWTGSFEWDSSKNGYFSKTACTVYDQNGQNPQSVYGVEFVLTADDISENVQKSVMLTNKYTVETVDLTATKKWISPTGAAIGWPAGKTVQFELGKVENGSFVRINAVAAVVLDNQTDQSGEERPGSAVFRRMPKYEDGSDSQLITYAVRESGTVSGYNVIYPTSSASYAVFGSDRTATIKNQVEAVSVSVTKNWLTPGGNVPPAGAEAVMRVYAYTGTDASDAVWVQNVNDVTLDGTADAAGESSPWVASFHDLPKCDSAGAVWHYIVKEVSCTPVGYSAVEAYAADGGSITNQPAVTSFSVTKNWLGTANDAWPGNTEITFTLNRKTRSGTVDHTFFAEYRLTAGTVTDVDQHLDWKGDPFGVSWNGSVLQISGLPVFSDSGDQWLYYVTETPVAGFETIYRNESGYLMDGAASSGGTILNSHSGCDLVVQKTVTGNFGSLSKAFDFTIQLSRTSDNSACTGSVTYVKTHADGSQTTSALELSAQGTASFRLSHNETIRFQDLSSDLDFTIAETGSSDGYRTTVAVNGGSPVSARTASGSLSSETTVLFTNTRDGIVPTDTDLSVAAVLILAAGICGVLCLHFVRRRKQFLYES